MPCHHMAAVAVNGLNIYNLLIQVYALAKFHPRMPVTLGDTTLQNSATTVYLYSKYMENYRHLLKCNLQS